MNNSNNNGNKKDKEIDKTSHSNSSNSKKTDSDIFEKYSSLKSNLHEELEKLKKMNSELELEKNTLDDFSTPLKEVEQDKEIHHQIDPDQLSEHQESQFKLKKEVKKLHEEIEKLKNDKLLALANAENLKNDYKREYHSSLKYRSFSFLLELLPVIDSFEIALSSKNVSSEVKNYLIGFEFIHKKLMDLLKHEGVKEIDIKIGSKFNSQYQQVLETFETDKYEKDCVVEIKQKGYMLHDRVLRVATVITSTELKDRKDD